MPESAKAGGTGRKKSSSTGIGVILKDNWMVPLVTVLLTVLTGAVCIRFLFNGSLLWAGGVLIVGSIVFAIIFFVTWVTRRYRIRQELIITYGRECCAPFRTGGIWEDTPEIPGSQS